MTTDVVPTLTDSPANTKDTPESQKLEGFSQALLKVAKTTEAHSIATGEARKDFALHAGRAIRAVYIFATLVALASIAQQWRQNTAIERIESLAVDVRESGMRASDADANARAAQVAAVEARQTIQDESPRVIAEPTKPGKPPRAALVVPARPATSTAPAVPSASFPIDLGTTTGGASSAP